MDCPFCNVHTYNCYEVFDWLCTQQDQEINLTEKGVDIGNEIYKNCKLNDYGTNEKLPGRQQARLG